MNRVLLSLLLVAGCSEGGCNAFGKGYGYGFSFDRGRPVSVRCGDGIVNGSDVCDDGGTSAGDGCSATCSVEAGWTCNGASPTVCTLNFDGLRSGDHTNATADNFECGDQAAFSGAAELCCSMWVQAAAQAALTTLIGQTDAGSQQAWALRKISGDNIEILISSSLTNETAFVRSSWLLDEDGTWRHLAFWYDGTESSGNLNRARLYRDGAHDSSATAGGGTIPAAILNSSAEFAVGATDGVFRNFSGLIHNAACWVGTECPDTTAGADTWATEQYNSGDPVNANLAAIGAPDFYYPLRWNGSNDSLPTVNNQGSVGGTCTAGANFALSTTVP